MHLLPSCPSPTHLCFFSGKIPSNVAARLTRKYWVPNFRHFVTIPPPSTLICHYLLLFVTIRDYSSLFATIRHYSHYSYYSYYSWLFAVRYSRLFAIRYSGFPDTRCECAVNLKYKYDSVNIYLFEGVLALCLGRCQTPSNAYRFCVNL